MYKLTMRYAFTLPSFRFTASHFNLHLNLHRQQFAPDGFKFHVVDDVAVVILWFKPIKYALLIH